MRSIGVLIIYPNCLVLYTRPLKNARLKDEKIRAMQTLSDTPIEATKNVLSGKPVPNSFRLKGERRFVLRPRHKNCMINTKETIGGSLGGLTVNKLCYVLA
jgi:hypothetical protein